MRIKTQTHVVVSLLLAFCLLSAPITALGKKGDKSFKRGLDFEAAQQWEAAAREFTLAVAADPANVEYQLHFRRACFNASQAFMQQGRSLAEQRDFVGAYNSFRQAYGYDPVNELAVSEMERMLRLQAVKEGRNVSTNARPGELPDGTALPANATEASVPTSSRTEQMRVINYSGDLKAFIRSLAEQLQLNVIFDRQSFVQPKTIDINLKEVSTSQALDYIFLQENLFFQKLSRRTILVADQTRRPQYQQLVLRTFYLANSEPDKVKSLVSQAIPASVGRPQTIVVADKDTNSLTVRDTAENVRLIGELIQSIDKDRAEVVMDVNIYEVSKSNFLQFGNQVGTGAGLPIGGSPGYSLLTDNGVLSNAQRGVNLAGIVGGVPTALAAALVIPPSVLHAFASKNNTKLIASTQVHAFNGEESTARIGQRVPVQTAQAYPFGVQTGQPTTGTTFPSGGFPVINYEPTGLTLKFTPQVFPNQDVQVKMSIESKDVIGASTLTPTFTERTITGTARVQNNKTMMLASVSTDVQAVGRQGLPILGFLPVLGRLFTAPTNDNRRIDIVIAVTPRVLRAPAVTPRDEEMRPSGTLQSPTTGTLEAMLREADRDDRLAALEAEKQAAAVAQRRPAVSPEPTWKFHDGSQPAAATDSASNAVTQPAISNSLVPKETNTSVASNVQSPVVTTSQAATTTPSQVAKSTSQTATKEAAGSEELPAFVPAPKSLVSSSAAADVAAVNSNLKGDGHAVLTSLAKPIETAINPSATSARSVHFSLTPAGQPMKTGETRRLAVDLQTQAPLSFAVLALRFDPKVVKVKAILNGDLLTTPDGKPFPGITQSIDPSGLCLISISNNGLSGQSFGNLLFIEVEAIADGDPGFVFDKDAMHLVAKDAKGTSLEVTPARDTPKQ
ncbi:MAG TPA: secretin N-terminal domain-containing protein [Pyrinomonadaceae bacterium]|nr:secretin N-terminal domain-containing protein [Pyrinomonadaceae bacterium]